MICHTLIFISNFWVILRISLPLGCLSHRLQEEALQNASSAEGRDGRGELQTELELLVHFPTLQPDIPIMSKTLR